MEDLGTRFMRVMENHRKEQIMLQKCHQSLDEIIPKLMALERRYSKAVQYLRPEVRTNCHSINSNICVGNGYECRLFTPKDFIDEIDSKRKESLYFVIRDYLRLKEKENNLRSKIENLRWIFFPPRLNLPSENTIKFLYAITSGNSGNFVKLAKLTTQICLPCKVKNHPTVVLANRAQHEPFINFIYWLSKNRVGFGDLNSATKTINLLSIHDHNINQRFAVFINTECKIPENRTQVLKLKGLMTEKNISVKHPYFPGTIFVKNKIPFIYLTENHNSYVKMKNIYSAIGIELPTTKTDLPFPDIYSIQWCQSVLSELGYCFHNKMLKTQKTQNQKHTSKETEDDVIKQFLKKICVLDNDAVSTKEEVYQAYRTFFKTHYGQQPLGKNVFGKKISILANLETIRPHKSRKSFPYCFKGIQIDKDKLNYLSDSPLPVIVETDDSYEKFKAYINDLIGEYNRTFCKT